MRKKSHISLAKGVIHGLGVKDRITHRLSFYIGSIWPDCTPSFITKRHCVDETFEVFMDKMSKFINKFNPKKDMGIVSTWRMGVVLHYIADYFTFPHNKHYSGTLKDHCIYEEELKHSMYDCVDGVRAVNKLYKLPNLLDIKQIEQYIKEIHSQYMTYRGNVDLDCNYAFSVCMSVMSALLDIVSGKNQVSVEMIA